MTKLATEGAVNAQAQIESELALVQRALALAKNGRQRAESEHGAARKALAWRGKLAGRRKKRTIV